MIDLTESADEIAIASAVADVLSGSAAESAGRRWQRATELGWLALGVPEERGGVGFGPAEQAALFRELGRGLADGPFLGAAMAAHLAVTASEEVPGGVLDGSLRVAVATAAEPAGRWHAWVDEIGADALLLLDRTGPLHLVALDLTRVVARQATLDRGHALWTVETDPSAPVLAAHDNGTVDLGRVLAAAYLTGIAEQARDDSVRHAGRREQYGRPIGGFQAVKHRCADMAVRAEAAWSSTSLAVVELAAGRGPGAFDAAAALLVARDAALRNGRDNIQNHGAMGFTSEYVGHRYVTRAHVAGLRIDGPADQRRAVVEAGSPW